MHEFEALLFCDLAELQKRIDGAETGISSLRREVDGLEPEDINAGVGTSPSKRIIKHVPIYNTSKLRVGAPAAAAIGLPKLRARCPRFHQWVEKLEALGATPK